MVELEIVCTASCKDAVLCDLYTLYPWAEIVPVWRREGVFLRVIVPTPDRAAQSVLLALPGFYGGGIISLNWYRVFSQGEIEGNTFVC